MVSLSLDKTNAGARIFPVNGEPRRIFNSALNGDFRNLLAFLLALTLGEVIESPNALS
jgi:hypothetical protein